MSDESDRETAADVLDGVATGLGLVPTNPVTPLLAAAFGLAASLVRKLGVGDALKTLKEIRARLEAGEGTITDAELSADDAKVKAELDRLFGPKP